MGDAGGWKSREVEALLLHDQDWQRLSMSEGTKGPGSSTGRACPILHRWEDDGQHWLLIRRSLTDPQRRPTTSSLRHRAPPCKQMVKAIGARWHIEEDFETAKDMGLDHYEVRSFDRLVSPYHAGDAGACLLDRDLCPGPVSLACPHFRQVPARLCLKPAPASPDRSRSASSAWSSHLACLLVV